jgi:hypothetical protein
MSASWTWNNWVLHNYLRDCVNDVCLISYRAQYLILITTRFSQLVFAVETYIHMTWSSDSKTSRMLRMLSLRKHILTNLKCASGMLSVTILKRNVTRLRIETIDYTSRSLSILAAQTSRFLLTFLFFLMLQTQIYMSCTLQTRSNMNYKIDNLLF